MNQPREDPPGPHRFSRASAAFVILVGGAVLVGWTSDVEALKSVVPGLVSMKANTAACFVLAGLARARVARAIPEGLSGVILAVAGATIAEYLTGRDLGLDRFLFEDPASVRMGLPPGRMALATAVAFALTGTSLTLVARRRRPVLAQALTLLAVLIPLTSLLAYLFGERAITATSPYTSLAINTAVAFAALGAGILRECSEAGPMAVFVAEGPGGTSLRRLLPLAVATTLTLGFAAFLGARAGLYSHASGMVLFAVVTSVALSAAIWANAWLLDRTERARRRDRDWLQLTLRSIGDAVIATDVGGRVQFLNPVAEGLTGWAGAEAEGLPLGSVFRVVDEATRVEPEDPVARALAAGGPVGLAGPTLLIARDGAERPIDDSAAPIRDGRGGVTGVVVVFRDVTDRRRAEEEGRRLDDRRRLALDSARLGSWNIDFATEELKTDERFRAIFGVDAGHLPFREAVELIHPEDRGRVLDAIAASTRPDDPQPYALEYRVVHPGGAIRWVSAKGRSNFTGEGAGRRLASFDGTVADVTDRMGAEEATRRRAAQFQKLAEIASRINSAHDVDSVVGVVTEEARGLVDARRAATSLVLDPRQPRPIHVVSDPGGPPLGADPPGVDGPGFREALGLAIEPIRLARGGLDADPRWPTLGRLAGFGPAPNGWLAAPLAGRDGVVLGLIQLSDKVDGEFTADDEAILVQLSRLAAIAIENARLYGELRGNDRRKDEFLAMLAHELRNPLAAISNAVKLASMAGPGGPADWSTGVVARQARHLSRLIDDLMDVSRITRGRIELRRAVVDAAPILESAAATVRALVDERGHALELALGRKALWVDVDPTRLEQVAVNLLVNAAKYSEDGGQIRLWARREGAQVVVGVEDRGVGIPPERLPEMFELFAQGDRSLARSEGGLGIGLTVVKKLVEMHGGAIAARSDGPGRGSEFVIRLPAAGAPPEARPPAEGLAPRAARILVVDDNADTARGMARLLKLDGHRVATAYGGPEAIEAARRLRPEFVLLDIGLPGMTGYEVAERLRREESCRDAVIVAVSGYGQDEDRRRSREAGFDHHLTKPLDHDALLALLSAGAGGRG